MFCCLLLEVSKATYSEVPNRRAPRNIRAGLEETASLHAYLLSKLIHEQSGIFVYCMNNRMKGGKKSE